MNISIPNRYYQIRLHGGIMPYINVVKNDANYDLNFTITQSDPSNENLMLPVDITDATITFKVAAFTNTKTLLVNGTCEIVTATIGSCKYKVASTDFTKVGNYMGELEIAYPDEGYGAKIITTQKMNIAVVTDLG